MIQSNDIPLGIEEPQSAKGYKVVKSFYRIWFKAHRNSSQAHSMIVYSNTIAGASVKAAERLAKTSPAFILTGRIEEFVLEDSGQFCRHGDLPSNLASADVRELCADLQGEDLIRLDNATRRIVDSLYSQEDALNRSQNPGLLPNKRRLPKRVG